MESLTRKELFMLCLTMLFFVVISLFTHFYGNTDIYDYSDVSRFFLGDYSAKIRTSHSFLYGLLNAPFVALTESYISFKVLSILSLLLIVYSVYLISDRNKKALWLSILSPIFWYMAPWISPIQLASLFFLWGYYFIREYDKKRNVSYLLYSGLLFGIGWAFWDGVLFFIPLILISFLYNRKLSHLIYAIVAIFIGTIPRIILDQTLFGFAFFTPLRHIMASLALTFLGGFYGQGNLSGGLNLLLVIVFLPFSSYLIFRRESFIEDKKTAFFIILSILLLIINSQVRFVLIIAPIIILSTFRGLDERKFRIQVIISLILILIVIFPYIIQFKYHIKASYSELGAEIGAIATHWEDVNLEKTFPYSDLRSDLNEIAEQYPGQVFVVGNRFDFYRVLANAYWGDKVLEFVSIEDYILDLKNESVIFDKTLCTNSRISTRRDFCFSSSNVKAFGDKTDYSSIKYAISEGNNLSLGNFKPVKSYSRLTLWEKV